MRDAKLVEPFAVQEIFVNGFSDHTTLDGVMSCAGYRLQRIDGGEEMQRVVVVRLVWPIGATEESIADAREAHPLQPHYRDRRH